MTPRDADPLDVTPPEFSGVWSVTAGSKGLSLGRIETIRPFLEEAMRRGQFEVKDGGNTWRFQPVDPALPRFREQRRRSRWGCSVALLAIVAALVVFWALIILFVATFVSAVTAAPRSAPVQPAQSGAPLVLAVANPRGEVRESAVGWYPYPDPVPSGAPLSALTYTGVVNYAEPSHGRASWYAARGNVASVPWWKPGQAPVWAIACRFADSRTRCVTVLVVGFCQCLVGQPGERIVDLSDGAFAQLAPLSVGLIDVTLEVGTAGPGLPATDREPVQ